MWIVLRVCLNVWNNELQWPQKVYTAHQTDKLLKNVSLCRLDNINIIINILNNVIFLKLYTTA